MIFPSLLSVSICGYSRRLSEREDERDPMLLLPLPTVSLPEAGMPHKPPRYSILGMIFSLRLSEYVDGALTSILAASVGFFLSLAFSSSSSSSPSSFPFAGSTSSSSSSSSFLSIPSKYSLLTNKLFNESANICGCFKIHFLNNTFDDASPSSPPSPPPLPLPSSSTKPVFFTTIPPDTNVSPKNRIVGFKFPSTDNPNTPGVAAMKFANSLSVKSQASLRKRAVGSRLERTSNCSKYG
mmetsp:Transcript_15037/g.26879  ORF Transcript_15037/g.26879 Transcript_15037/m.26879 type:complete len:239 (-) Transcript_15037:290-1006(-)